MADLHRQYGASELTHSVAESIKNSPISFCDDELLSRSDSNCKEFTDISYHIPTSITS